MASRTHPSGLTRRAPLRIASAFTCAMLVVLSPIFAQDTIAQTITSTTGGGEWSAISTWSGGVVPDESVDVVIQGLVLVTTGARCRNLNLRPAGVLQDATPFRVLTVHGDVLNEGAIRDNPNNGNLTVEIAGDVANHGTWQHRTTRLTGSADQTLSLALGRSFESAFSKHDSTGVIRAGSDLRFTREVDLWMGPVLDMQGHALHLSEEANILDGRAVNVGDLVMSSGAFLERSTLQGDMRLRGLVRAGIDVRFQGAVTVLDTLQNRNEAILVVDGNLLNQGVVRDDPNSGSLNISTFGDVVNEGTWTTRRVYLDGIGQRTIDARGIVSEIRSRGEGVVLGGANYIPSLILDGGSSTTLAAGATLTVDDWIQWSVFGEGLLQTFGTLIEYRSISGTDDSYLFHHLDAGISASQGFDGLRVTTYGHQAPRTFANAVRKWWKLEASPASEGSIIPWVAFNYEPEELAGQVESELEVFYSDDDGQTWNQISTAENLTRLTNAIRMTDVPASGAFALSTNTEPVHALMSVVPSILGRDQIRQGPPTRYTMHYFNNSDLPSGDMLMQLTTGGGIRIEALELKTNGAGIQIFPIDSLTYDGVDTEVYLWVTSMAPGEERSFDAIVRAFPVGAGKADQRASGIAEPADFGKLVFGIWKGPDVGEAIMDFTTSFTKDIWGQLAACDEVSDALLGTFVSSAGNAAKGLFGLDEAPMKKLGQDTMEGMTKLSNPVLAGLFSAGKDAKKVHDAADSAWDAFFKYQQGGVFDSECLAEGPWFGDHSESSKDPEHLQSIDPNAKAGPSGHGAQGFISSAGRVHYQIFFENLATATAPAYRIVITDTLSEVFDPETVAFGLTSHEGEAYDWQITRNGSVLRWEIEGIELVPNVNPPEGEGYVTFSVMTEPGLPSGTELRNRAEIVFDFNEPILTNEAVNTLDFEPPLTTMAPLGAESTAPEIVVRWSSDDGTSGSGVEATVLFASRDGGPFEPVGTTDADSLRVAVVGGSTYAFYALGRDHVGNAERTLPGIVQTAVLVGVEDSPEGPFVFGLKQNYPNPFNPSTQIEFSVAERGETTLVVYNLLGQRIATVMAVLLEPGEYQVHWDAGGLASGVYFCRLAQGDRTSVRRMVLVR